MVFRTFITAKNPSKICALMLEALLKKGFTCLSRFALFHKLLTGITVNLESQWELWIGQGGHTEVHLIASDRSNV